MNLKALIRRLFKIVCISLFLVISGCSESDAEDSEKGFKIVYFSVGQGDSALVICDGHNMMIDCGTSGGGNIQSVYEYLKTNNINHFDYLICSHPDSDHYNGFVNILKRGDNLDDRSYNKVLSPITKNDDYYDAKAFIDFTSKYNKNFFNKISKAKEGDHFKLGSADIDILASDSVTNKTNNRSIVLTVTYNGKKFLFPGDAEWDLEKYLIDNHAEQLKCDVLKVAHHGSSTSSSDDFLYKCSPTYAIISASGFDVCPVIDRLDSHDIAHFNTSNTGLITCTIENGRIIFRNTDERVLNDE